MTQVFGLLNVNKPAGPTSHDIVAAVRRGIGVKRVGHAGTLDPLAEGVLILALGKATRLAEYLMQSPKRYLAQVLLGVTTDTYDVQGQAIEEQEIPLELSAAEVVATLMDFHGEILQTPPVYSAVKVRGRAAYARARAGETVELAPRTVTIHEIALIEFVLPRLMLEVFCSPGTYIRTLVHDLGQALGCGAVLERLTRTASGDFTLTEAVPWEMLQAGFADGRWQAYLIPADRALPDTPQIRLTAQQWGQAQNGAPVASQDVQLGLARAYRPDGCFVAVLRGDPEASVWHPHKVFVER